MTGVFYNPLYKVINSDNSIVVDGIRSAVEVADIIVGPENVGHDLYASMELLDQVTASAETPETLQGRLFDTLGKTALLTSGDKETGRIALGQLGGVYGAQTLEPALNAAKEFYSGVAGRLGHLRDQTRRDIDAVQAGDAWSNLAPSIAYEEEREQPGDRLWVGGLGTWTRQKNADKEIGYKYDSWGGILGYDREYGPFTIGVGAAYIRGKTATNDSYTRTTSDNASLGLYAAYDRGSGLYADAVLGYAYSWNGNETSMLIGGKKTGRFNTTSYYLGGDLGYAMLVGDDFQITPSVGAHFTHIRQGGWRENASDPELATNWFDAGGGDFVEIPVAMRLAKTWRFGDCGFITPEVRAAWLANVKDAQPTVRAGYVGSTEYAVLRGINPGRSRGLVGGGLKTCFNANFDCFVDYNLEFKSSYRNHNLSAGLGASF